MKIINFLLTLIFLSPSILFAQNKIGRVLKVTKSKNLTLVRYTKSFTPIIGNSLIITSPNGETCEVPIKKTGSNRRLVLNTKSCPFKHSIKKGDFVSKTHNEMDELISEEDLKEDKQLTDFDYRPKENESIYDLTIFNRSGDYEYHGTTTVSKNSTSELGTNHDFQFGFNKKLALALSFSYIFNKKEKLEEYKVNGKETDNLKKGKETNDNGLGDIGLGVNYRILSEAQFSLDLEAKYALSPEDAKRSTVYGNIEEYNKTGKITYTVSEDGNVSSGGNTITLEAQGNAIINPKLQFQGSLKYEKHSERKITFLKVDANRELTKDIDLTTTTESSSDFTISLKGQYYLTPLFSIGASYTSISFGEKTIKYKFTFDEVTTKIEAEKYNAKTVGVFGSYNISQDVAIVLGFNKYNEDDRDLKITDTTSSNTTNSYTNSIKDFNYTEIFVRLRLNYD